MKTPQPVLATHNENKKKPAIQSGHRFIQKLSYYCLAAVVVTLGYLLRYTLESWIGHGLPPYITFYPAVILVMMFLGFGPGIFATGLIIVVVDLMILPPVGSFYIDNPVDLLGVVLFSVTCLLLGIMTKLYESCRNKAATIDKEQALSASQENLYEYQERLASIVENSEDAIISVDLNEIISTWNKGAEKIFDYKAEEVIGKPITLLLPQELHEKEKLDFDGVMYGEQIELYETVRIAKDGRLINMSVKLSPVKDNNGRVIGVSRVARDISSFKQAEEQRKILESKMLHSQKLESLGVLAGGIAHDFNNILMAIIGNTDLAIRRMNPESPAIENLKRIENAAAQATDLARQMLAYSGKGKFVIENLDLGRLLEEMLHMLEVSISKKAVLRLNLAPNLPLVEADATQIRQVIMNLVINASEAIGDKSGVIAITTGCMDYDKNYLKNVWLVENIKEGLYVYIEIADTGCGMDKETITKIFDPFFTTKFTGRGLGMAAVLGILRGHKGAIRVFSEPKKGTTFKIFLPASNRPAEIFNQYDQLDNWRGVGTVLLVDDEESVRGIAKGMLHELGFDTITAIDGREAIKIFKSNPDIDCVILDLTMPHMDGEQCFRELRHIKPEVKVIISSGYNEQEVTQKFVGKGLTGFIQKPYKLSVLKEAIKKI